MGLKRIRKTQPKDCQEDEMLAEAKGGGDLGRAKGSIKWNTHLGRLLAYKLRNEYTSKYVCDTRINVAKQWAIDLRIGHQDPRGIKTKGAIGIMLKKYRKARCLYDRTGSGDIVEKKVINGQEVSVVKTLIEQCKDICPHWEILFGHLQSIDEEASASTAGLNRHGIKGLLVIRTGSQIKFQVEEEDVLKKPDDDITQDEDDNSGDDFDRHVSRGQARNVLQTEAQSGREEGGVSQYSRTQASRSQSQSHSQYSPTQALPWSQTQSEVQSQSQSQSHS
ncbi:hypothetical protein L211DRAFT_854171 [Terfezia boudieri ATCC MYA-4762]|uniref:Uncharacterized protein n=1 Tax=Terfezia boudieri ATCC MYA-4762 TaxID=1051890 RepID=A0A3N4LKD5_9PEZI|nr:hypothetical protein L211DRAFT_854171 [Terfezia boudieri ATCC MYA-4762]